MGVGVWVTEHKTPKWGAILCWFSICHCLVFLPMFIQVMFGSLNCVWV